MSRRLVVLAAVLSICITSALGAATRTWTGASSANWSDPANWSPSGAPTNGDDLSFPFTFGQVMNNDLPSGTTVGSMTLNGIYTLNGNDLVVNGDIFVPRGNTLICNVGLKLMSSVTFSDGSLIFGGAVDVNGQTLSLAGFSVSFTGPINGSGSIIGHMDGPDPFYIRGGGAFSGTIYSTVDVASSIPNAKLMLHPPLYGPAQYLFGNGTVGTVDVQFAYPGDCQGCYGDPSTIGSFYTKSLTIGTLYADVTPSGASDSFHVTGTVTITGDLGLGMVYGVPAVGQKFTLIDNDGTDPVNGTFTNLPEGTKVVGFGYAYSISYVGGDGNDVVVTFESGAKHKWTGAASPYWSNPANWSPQNIPSAGEAELLFPAGASNRTMVNDLPPGLAVGKLTFNDHYTLNGNDLALSGDLRPGVNDADVVCNTGLKLMGPLILSGTFGGAIDVNGQNVTAAGKFTGPINGSGSIIAGGEIRGGGTFSGTITGTMTVVGAFPNADIVTTDTGSNIGFFWGSGTVGNLNALFLSPGDNCLGTCSGDLHTIGVFNTKSLTIRGHYFVDLLPSGAGDSMHVTGSASVAGPLSISTPSGLPAAGQSFTIIDNDGTDPVIGTFTGLPEGASIAGNGYSFRISYVGGDGNDVVLTLVLNTSTALTQDSSLTSAGQPVTFTATLSALSGTPSGVVSFTDGGVAIGTAPLVNGVAHLTTSALAAGAHSIVATYAGQSGYASSVSSPLPHTVKYQTSTTLAVDHTSGVYGGTLIFTASVSPVAPGTITLRSDGASIGTFPLVKGGATINVGSLLAGPHTVTASYSGSSDYEASDSNAIQVMIARAPTTLEVHSDQNPAAAGSAATLTVKLNSLATPLPVAGLIVVSEGGKLVAQQGVIGATTKVPLPVLSPGSHILDIAFSGTDNFDLSSVSFTQVVSLPAVYANDVSVAEGNAGTTAVQVTLHLSTPSPQSVRVDWKTGDASALSGEDYEAASGVVEFAPGETSRQITVVVDGDTKAEEDESFNVVLSNAVNATLARTSSVVIITNDDATSKTFSGLSYGNGMTLDLYVPVSGAQPYPVIVWVPGFTAYDSDATVVPALHETLRGYAVAVVRYHNPSDAHFPAQLDDLKSAVRFLRANASQYGLDPQHIAAWGNGTGAHLAALLGMAGDTTAPSTNAAFSSVVQAVVDWNGASDLASLNADAASCNVVDHDAASSPESTLLGCPLQTCGVAATTASPMTYAHSGLPPFLLMHAAEDCYVAPSQSQKLYAALIATGDDATLHVYNGVSHVDSFWRSATALGVVEAFLDGKLKKPRPPTRGRGVRH
jgi:acetyl esterase/lipase